MLKLGCCGDDCNYCLRYIGTVNHDEKTLKKAAEIWLKLGWRDHLLPPDEMKCSGCATVKNCAHGIKECCETKKAANCGRCDDYPCGKNKLSFEKAKKIKAQCKSVLEAEDFETLNKAFYMKEAKLNRVRRK
jgi:hypothetical protein